MEHKTVIRLFALILLIHVSIVPHTALSQISWPEGKVCAIVLTYDDALQSQLNHAIPQLDQFGLKGTFFLSGNFHQAAIPRWREAAANGHELGNHTIFHPCSETILPDLLPQYYSENYTVETILDEIAFMGKMLYAIDGKEKRTYAYPCNETVVGGKDYIPALAASNLVTYTRSGDNERAVITDISRIDPMKIPSRSTSNNPDAEGLIDFVQNVKEQNALGIFTFHGVGGEHLAVTADAHKALLEYLHEHKREIWVATFQQVMDYLYGNKKN